MPQSNQDPIALLLGLHQQQHHHNKDKDNDEDDPPLALNRRSRIQVTTVTPTPASSLTSTSLTTPASLSSSSSSSSSLPVPVAPTVTSPSPLRLLPLPQAFGYDSVPPPLQRPCLAPSQPFKVAIQRQVAPAYYPNNVVDLVPTKPGRGRKLGSKNKPKGPATVEANKEPQRPKKRGPKPKPPEGRAQRPAERPHRIPTKDPPVADIAEQLSDEERCILERERKRLDDVYKPGMRSRQGDSTMKKYWEELFHWKAFCESGFHEWLEYEDRLREKGVYKPYFSGMAGDDDDEEVHQKKEEARRQERGEYLFAAYPEHKVLAFFNQHVFKRFTTMCIPMTATAQKAKYQATMYDSDQKKKVELKLVPNESCRRYEVKQTLSISALENVYNMIVALHKSQAGHSGVALFSSHPAPREWDRLKALKDTFNHSQTWTTLHGSDIRDTLCPIRDGYSVRDMVKLSKYLLYTGGTWAQITRSHKTRAQFLLRHHGLFRDHDLRNMEFSECFAQIIHPLVHNGTQQAVALTIRITRGKTNQQHDSQFAAIARHEWPERCAFGAFAFYLFAAYQSLVDEKKAGAKMKDKSKGKCKGKGRCTNDDDGEDEGSGNQASDVQAQVQDEDEVGDKNPELMANVLQELASGDEEEQDEIDDGFEPGDETLPTLQEALERGNCRWPRYKVFPSRSAPTKSVAKGTNYMAARLVFELHSIFSPRVTHAGRYCGAREVDDMGVQFADIALGGRWANTRGKLGDAYLGVLPSKFAIGLAGFQNKPYHNHRDTIPPPIELQRMVFPWIEKCGNGLMDWEELCRREMEGDDPRQVDERRFDDHKQRVMFKAAQPQRAQNDPRNNRPTAAGGSEWTSDFSNKKGGFLRLLVRCRRIILQDAAVLMWEAKQEGKEVPLFNHPLFKTQSFLDYQEDVLKDLLTERHSGLELYKRVTPLTAKAVGRLATSQEGATRGFQDAIQILDKKMDKMDTIQDHNEEKLKSLAAEVRAIKELLQPVVPIQPAFESSLSFGTIRREQLYPPSITAAPHSTTACPTTYSMTQHPAMHPMMAPATTPQYLDHYRSAMEHHSREYYRATVGLVAHADPKDLPTLQQLCKSLTPPALVPDTTVPSMTMSIQSDTAGRSQPVATVIRPEGGSSIRNQGQPKGKKRKPFTIVLCNPSIKRPRQKR